jgi:hypothetical protein
MDGLPAVRDGGNVLRPYTTAKISLRLPPDVDAQVAADALISAITTDEGAHITIDWRGWPMAGSPPRSTSATPMRWTGCRRLRFGHAVGFHGEGGTIPFLADLKRSFPSTQFVATGRPRPALQRARPQRVPAHPHGQGGDPRRGRAAQVACPDARSTRVRPGVLEGRWPWSPAAAAVWAGPWRWGSPMPGADVIVASRKLENCEEVAREIEARGRRALPVACHVGHWEELDGLVTASYDAFGRVDVLVNNAGMSLLYESLTAVSEMMWDKVVDLNLKGPFRLTALMGIEDGG